MTEKLTRKLRTREAAEYLTLSMKTLENMRWRGDGPAYSKAGTKIVLYDICDLDRWLAESTAQATAA